MWQRKIIKKPEDFDLLFEGFMKPRAITFVASPLTIIDFFNRLKYEKIEIFLSEPFHENLNNADIIEKLTDLTEKEKIKIFIPKRKTIHSKLYILEEPSDSSSITRVIVGSPNFTEPAKKASYQTNYVVYWDFSANDLHIQEFIDDYEEQKQIHKANLFLSDLIELFQKQKDIPRRQIIETVWLNKSEGEKEIDTDLLQNVQNISLQSMELSSKNEKILNIHLPEKPEPKKKLQNYLSDIVPIAKSDNTKDINVDVGTFQSFVQAASGIPLMRVFLEKGEVNLIITDKLANVEVEKPMFNVLTEPLPDRGTVNKSLEHIEAFINTVDLGKSSKPIYVKTCMYEALLYVLAAPFANEYMSLLREKFALAGNRGPQYLLIYGKSGNGKSQFLDFCLYLLSGYHIKPIDGKNEFKIKKIKNALYGTEFPLVFDDVNFSKHRDVEELLKSYWETWWKEDKVFPQIIMATNHLNQREWALTRVKKIDFDVQFERNNTHNLEYLNSLMKTENHFFYWFSLLYIQDLKNKKVDFSDDLFIARNVMQKLYSYSGRQTPDFFPAKPLEDIYNLGHEAWEKIFYLGKVKERRINGEIRLTFSEDMEHQEIKKKLKLLPTSIKYSQEGKTVVIEGESANEFDRMMGKTKPKSIFSRVLARVGLG